MYQFYDTKVFTEIIIIIIYFKHEMVYRYLKTKKTDEVTAIGKLVNWVIWRWNSLLLESTISSTNAIRHFSLTQIEVDVDWHRQRRLGLPSIWFFLNFFP